MPEMTLAGAMILVGSHVIDLGYGNEEWRGAAECVLEGMEEDSPEPMAAAANWILNATDAELSEAHGQAAVANPTVAEGLAILNAAKDPDVLVALLKCFEGGMDYMCRNSVSGHCVGWAGTEIREEASDLSTLLLALAETLEKGGGGNG